VRRAAAGLLLLAAAGGGGCATLLRGARVSGMTLEEKIGQLFVYVSTGRFMNESSAEYQRLLHYVRDDHIGGIHWGTWSLVHETAFLNRRLQAAARVPLLVSADLESGVGMRFSDVTFWPWAMALGATGDPSLARRQGEALAQEARAIGLNQVYAPVADVNVNPANPVINVRSYGEDPEMVARFVSAFVQGVQSRGVLATVKHFPGHGDTEVDSHRSIPILRITRDRLDRIELVPFRAAVAAGAGSVMTAHVSLPALDDTPAPPLREEARRNVYDPELTEVALDAMTPASLSPRITRDLLRNEMRFEGLIVTDALDMGGITVHFDPGEAAVQALLAGADQVLKSPRLDDAIAGVRRAVESGRISRERIDESVSRVLAAKARFPAPRPSPRKAFRVVDSAEHRALAAEIGRRAVTLVREEAGVLPLQAGLRLAHVAVQGAVEAQFGDLTRELARRLGQPPETFSLDARATDAEVGEMLEAVGRADAVLLSLFVRFRSGEGKIHVPEAAAAAIERIAATGKPIVAVAFGSPFLIQELPQLRTYFVAYGGQDVMQVAIAQALFGEIPITGRLPVTIPEVAARGDGIRKPATAAAPAEAARP
jgi:beta-glucosidase-like glycosyl hydrolase